MVLLWNPWLFKKSHGLFWKSHTKFKNGKDKLKKLFVFHILICHFVEKRSVFYVYSCCVLHFILYGIQQYYYRDEKKYVQIISALVIERLCRFCKSKFNWTWMKSYPVWGVLGDPYKFFVFLAGRNCLVIIIRTEGYGHKH